MKWLLSLFGGNLYGYLIGGALVAVLSTAASAFIVSNVKNVEIANLKADAANTKAASNAAALTQLQGFIATMNINATDYTEFQAKLTAAFAKIHGDFINASKASPLPVDCKPDALRVRSLNAAISAANNTAAGQ